MRIEDAVDRLEEAGLLTERQAEAWVLREVEAVPRQAAAESMGISINVLDKHLRAARDKVDAVEETAEAIGAIRHEEIPDNCGNCGEPLGGRWAESEDGDVFCLDCSGIDPADVALD